MIKNLKFHFFVAFLIRIIFTIYGLYHDFKSNQSKQQIPKYTDVDYQVFTDAASYVFNGESPYLRDTYRYTPLLSYLILPNIFLNESFGKFLFIVFDLACGSLILKINDKNDKNLYSILFWFYNPITIAIASRGNAESLMSFLVLCFIYFLKKRMFVLSGVLYGLAIHFKIYPVTYALALGFYMTDFRKLMKQKPFFIIKSIFTNLNLVKFGLSAFLVLASLTLFFYKMYGYVFLYETYLYHLERKDVRHNFSPYFYMLYLTDTTNLGILKFFSFIPQLMLIVTSSFYLYQHIELCLFLITFTFVTFNKVCTSQYFVWYLSLIPIIVPRLDIDFKSSLGYFILWMFGQSVWLYFGYELEFNGLNTFLSLWLAGLLFTVINCLIIKNIFLNKYNFKLKLI